MSEQITVISVLFCSLLWANVDSKFCQTFIVDSWGLGVPVKKGQKNHVSKWFASQLINCIKDYVFQLVKVNYLVNYTTDMATLVILRRALTILVTAITNPDNLTNDLPILNFLIINNGLRVTESQTLKGTQYTGGWNFFVPDFN